MRSIGSICSGLVLIPTLLLAGTSKGPVIQTFRKTDRIVVAKQELTAEYLYAMNTTTQKQIVYEVRVKDKFENELFSRKFDIPFSKFADDNYGNEVTVRPVIGDSGVGVAVISVLGPEYNALREIDLVGVRTVGAAFLGARGNESVRILRQMPNHFIGADLSPGPISLLRGDMWTYRHWTGSFYLMIPLVIDWYGILSLPNKITDFSIVVPTYKKSVGKIIVYSKPNSRSRSAFLYLTPTADVKFLRGSGRVKLDGQNLSVENIAVRVEVNGRSGWIIDPENFAVLGLSVPY